MLQSYSGNLSLVLPRLAFYPATTQHVAAATFHSLVFILIVIVIVSRIGYGGVVRLCQI